MHHHRSELRDDAVRRAHRMAQTKRWVLLRDASLDRYEEIPTWDYASVAAHQRLEAYEQPAETNSPLPTHLILRGVDRLLAVLWVILLKKCRKISPILLWLSRIRPTVFINQQLWMMVNLTASLAIWRR